MPLYHVSNDPDIARFEPRQIGNGPAQVWAIDEAHLCNYLVPRDCPRVCFRPNRTSTADDVALLESALIVVAIEAAWEERVRAATVAVYDLPIHAFEIADRTAGYWTSRAPIVPLGCRVLYDLPAELAARGATLRVLPSLWPLHDRVRTSTLDFSLIRMRYAQPR